MLRVSCLMLACMRHIHLSANTRRGRHRANSGSVRRAVLPTTRASAAVGVVPGSMHCQCIMHHHSPGADSATPMSPSCRGHIETARYTQSVAAAASAAAATKCTSAQLDNHDKSSPAACTGTAAAAEGIVIVAKASSIRLVSVADAEGTTHAGRWPAVPFHGPSGIQAPSYISCLLPPRATTAHTTRNTIACHSLYTCHAHASMLQCPCHMFMLT